MEEMPKIKVILERGDQREEMEYEGVTVIGQDRAAGTGEISRWGQVNLADALYQLLDDTPMSAQALAIGAMLAKHEAEEAKAGEDEDGGDS